MKKLLIIILLVCPFVTFSQINHNEFPSDSTSQSWTKKAILRKTSAYIPPALFIAYGFMSLDNNVVKRIDHSVYADMQEDHPGFSTHIDNYLQYAPAAAMGLLSLSGVRGKSSFNDRAVQFAMTTAILSSSVTFFKRSTNKFRPNQSSYTSFPSGHTSVAFATAEFLNQEYGDKSIWIGIAGYTAATATGILRVYNNAHWFSDVVAGAGFGILSAKATYLIYPGLKKALNLDKKQFKMVPSYQKGYSGFTLSGKI